MSAPKRFIVILAAALLMLWVGGFAWAEEAEREIISYHCRNARAEGTAQVKNLC